MKRVYNLTQKPIFTTINGKELLWQPSDGNPLNPKGVEGIFILKKTQFPHPHSPEDTSNPIVDPSMKGRVVNKLVPVLDPRQKKKVGRPFLDVDDETHRALFFGRKVEVHQGLGPKHPATGEKLNGLAELKDLEDRSEGHLNDLQESLEAKAAELEKAESKLLLAQQALAEATAGKSNKPAK